MGSLNLKNEQQQCLLSLDFVRILMFAHKQDTWLPTLLYNTILTHQSIVELQGNVCFSLFGIHPEQAAVCYQYFGHSYCM